MEWHDLQKDAADMPYLEAKRPWRTYDVIGELKDGRHMIVHWNEDEAGWIDSNGFRQQVRAWADIEPRTQKTAKKQQLTQTADIKSAMCYMASRGIPKNTIKGIYSSFVDQAIRDGENMKTDRIYTAFALSIRRAYGFGYKRIRNTFSEFSKLMDFVNADGHYWDELMDELYRETGMVIHCASDYDRIMLEYRCPNGEQEEMDEQELAAYESIVSEMEASASGIRNC